MLALLLLPIASDSAAQGTARRLATIDSLRQFPAYYHLQNVLLRGEFSERENRILFRADENEIRAILAENVTTTSGPVEVRAQMIDIGRLEASDPRASSFAEGRDTERWPRPGEELFIRVTAVTTAAPATAESVRALALEPWKFEGQTITVSGNFRGRNLFGDLPDTPGKSRYDFVLRGAEGAIWVTGLRPRGRGFELDVDRRVDSDRWVQITGKLAHDRGLVRLEATQIALSKAPAASEAAEEETAPAPPAQPAEVVFNSPSEGETDVTGNSPVRIQFSRGLNEASLAGRIRVTYLGSAAPSATDTGLQFKTMFDAANRAIEIRFAQPLEPLRTVKLELLEGITTFDGAPVKPWTLTFSVGG